MAPIEVTSGTSNELTITSQYFSDIEDDDIWLCNHAPVTVTFKVRPLIGNIEDYEDFSWRYYQTDYAASKQHALPTISSVIAEDSTLL